jgi:hypothetical protein
MDLLICKRTTDCVGPQFGATRRHCEVCTQAVVVRVDHHGVLIGHRPLKIVCAQCAERVEESAANTVEAGT